MALLLLPFVATPLAWVAMELLVHQTRSPDKVIELAIATDAANMVLQSQEGSDPASLQDGSNIKATADSEEELQNSLDITPGVDDAVANDRRPTAVLKEREVQFLEADVYNMQPHRIDRSKFQSLNMAACTMMYSALMCFSLSIVCCKFLLHACMLGQ